jgi:hypothetical protein
MKFNVENRLPSDMRPRDQFALYNVFRDLAKIVNDLVDTVMPKVAHSSAITADSLVKTGQSIYRGFTVTVVTATAAIDIRDATSAGSGTIIDTIPAGTAAGTRVEKQAGVICETGIYVDYGASATGTVVVLYE